MSLEKAYWTPSVLRKRQKTVVHSDKDCANLQNATEIRGPGDPDVFDEWHLCQRCDPEQDIRTDYDQVHPHHHKIAQPDFKPADAGLTPLKDS